MSLLEFTPLLWPELPTNGPRSLLPHGQQLSRLSGRGHELDLVLDFGKERWAVEVKLTASPAPENMARLNRTADLVRTTRRFLVTRTARPAGDVRQASCDLPWLLERLPTLV